MAANIINQAASSMMMRSNTLLFGTSSACHNNNNRDVARSAIHLPRMNKNNLQGMFAPNNIASSNIGLVEEISTRILIPANKTSTTTANNDLVVVMEKLYLILETVSDRVEMHSNIGEQRAHWNSLLLTSINTITLSAATMAAVIATTTTTSLPAASLEALKLSSTFLYLAATGMLVVMNKIQPSQLAEEQRNAARLFKQLEAEIKTKLSIGGRNLSDDVNEAMKKVLALDRAYPLPLIGVMLEKFPAKVKPAVWWPQPRSSTRSRHIINNDNNNNNGWSAELEEEMREIIRVLEIKDKDDYLRLGNKALKLNKALAIAGPLLTGLGAIGSACPAASYWAVMLGVMGGAMASVVNTVQHGGQVGMVFEMYRSNAGFFELMKESIESNLKEKDVHRRENGHVFEMKVALRLGRSLSELKDVAANSYSRTGDDDIQEFGSKLF